MRPSYGQRPVSRGQLRLDSLIQLDDEVHNRRIPTPHDRVGDLHDPARVGHVPPGVPQHGN